MPSLAELLEQLQPEQRPMLYGSTLGGAAVINPYNYVRSPEVSGLLELLMARNPNAPQWDDGSPKRNIMNVPRQPFGNIGVLGNPFPGARLPNAWRGPLTPQGQGNTPDVPEYYVPGFTKQWLRGT